MKTTTLPFLSSLCCVFVLLLPGSGSGKDVRGTIHESEFKREMKKEREAAFSPWMTIEQMQELLRKAELDKKVLLALERDSVRQMRAILWFPADGKGGDVTYDMSLSESELLEKHSLWEAQGFNILFVQKTPTAGKLCAVWIDTGAYGEAVKRCIQLGVTPAQIVLEKKGKEPSAPVVVVTAPLRQWKDKQGRAMEASVEGVEKNQVKFALKDGKKFSYQISELSSADQQFLADLVSKAAEQPQAAEPQGFTEWLSSAKFDIKYTEERGKGNYAIYIESNNRNELRALFEKRPEGLGWFMATLETEQPLREKHASYVSRGMPLLSLSYDRRTKQYNGVWVRENILPVAKSQLAALGITLGVIGDKITPSTVRKP